MPASSSSAVDDKNVITLKGSVEVVSEFFFTAINSILYQRGIYHPETFKRETKYGLTVLTTTDTGLITYLQNVMSQMGTWLLEGDVQRLVVVVTGVDSGEVLERWQFNVSVDDTEDSVYKTYGGSGGNNNNENNHTSHNIPSSTTRSSAHKLKSKKTLKEIQSEIRGIIKQITASVTFLPLLEEPCAFDLLVYTNKAAAVPKKWEDSDPCYILNSQEVKLRSFTTSFHKVESMVTYKEKDEWEL